MMKKKRLDKIVLASSLVFCCILLFSTSSAWAADIQQQRKGSSSTITSAQSSVDLAAGILDAGKLQHTVYNNGLLGTWGWSGYVIPELPAGWFKGYGYVPDFNIWIGIPEGPWTSTYTYWDSGLQDSVTMTGPTVSEAQLHGGTNQSDWDPTEESFGRYHSGDVTIGDVIPGAPLSTLPLMATSTIRESWPEDEDGERFWPGPWAIDPGSDGIARTEDDSVMVGQFTGDKEVFFSFTDDPYALRDERVDQGYPIGAQVDSWVISYGRSYAEDFLFFPCQIINNSDWNYTDVYVSFYLDIDVEEYDLDGIINDRMDWMSFITKEYEEELEDTVNYNMSFIYDYRPEPNWRPYVGVKLLETPRDSNGVQLGLTDWHWFEWENRPGVVIEERQELIQYKVISGDNTDLRPEEDAAYFHKDAEGNLDPHFDSPENIERLYPNGTDCVFIMSSGPFEWAPHETTTFSFCLLVGEGRADLKHNARTAQLMYDLNYLGANPPPGPEVTAVPGDGKVILYWDSEAEGATDIMTGYADFEGYKIYRTTSDPSNNEWGEVIKDAYGQEVGFVPLAQFDIDDGIKGLDPEYPHLNLGEDNGLVHSWTDETVKNGVTYWYTVTAYDRGVSKEDTVNNPDGWASLNSLETAKGSSPGFKFGPGGAEKLTGSPNLVMVIPGPKPGGWKNAEVSQPLEVLPGTQGNAPINFNVIDPFVVTGHSYIVSFYDSTFFVVEDGDTTEVDSLLFDVFDEVTDQYVLRGMEEINTQSTVIPAEEPVFDGLSIGITNWDGVDFWADSSYLTLGDQTDSTNMDFLLAPFSSTPTPVDYVLMFTEEGSASSPMFGSIPTPFEVWNITDSTEAEFMVQENADTRNRVWDDGEAVLLYENFQFTWSINVFARPDTTGIEEIDTIPGPDFHTVPTPSGEGVDTVWHYTYGDTLPLHIGDQIFMKTRKPIIGGDRFRFQTEKFTVSTTAPTALDSIKVVPNPYIVSAEWEINTNLREIHFTHLPKMCDIHIYTLTGEPVRTIHHENETVGWAAWDLLTELRQEVAYGLYIYVVETPDGRSKMGKFAIIR